MSITIAQDSFARANQSTWGTASDTEAWAVISGTASDYSISSNKGVITGSVATHITLLGTGTITNGDHFAHITPSASNDFYGFVFAYQDSVDYCYTEVTNGTVTIYK